MDICAIAHTFLLAELLALPDTPCLTPYPHVSGDLRHMPECLVRELNV